MIPKPDETDCCELDTNVSSDRRFLNAVATIGQNLGPQFYYQFHFEPLKDAFGEDFAAWFCKNRSHLPLQPFPDILPLNNSESWYEIFLQFAFRASGVKIQQHDANGPVLPCLFVSLNGTGHWNITPDENGERVMSLMKKTGNDGFVVHVSDDGAADDLGHVSSPFRPSALPIHKYMHTNDVLGYTAHSTPLSGYVDITGLHKVLSHRESGYNGELFFTYRHFAVHDSAKTWKNVLSGIIRGMSASHNYMMSVDFGFGTNATIRGKKSIPDFGGSFHNPEQSLMHTSLDAICVEISSPLKPRWLSIRSNNITHTCWEINDNVLANTETPKQHITVTVRYADSILRIVRRLV